MYGKERERERNVLFNDALNTFFIYGYMASDIWLRTILIVRKETRCRHIGYSYRLTARVLLYAPSHRQDNTYHGLCCTSRGALAGTRNSLYGKRLFYAKHIYMFHNTSTCICILFEFSYVILFSADMCVCVCVRACVRVVCVCVSVCVCLCG